MSLADKQDNGAAAQQNSALNMPAGLPRSDVNIHSLDAGSDMRVVSSTDSRQQREAEDARRVDDLISRPEIREILLDADIQRLMAALRNEPDKAQE